LILYENAENMPSTDTIKKIKHDLGIHFNGELTSFKSEVSIIRALSKDGTPMVGKFFLNKSLADHEKNIGKKLTENDING
jgi:hypothetical protein